MKKILLALFVTSALSASVNAQEVEPMTQEEFSWQDVQLESTYTIGVFNRVLRKISTITEVTNNTDSILEGDVYRYIISDPNLTPVSVGCGEELVDLTSSNDKFFYLPIQLLEPGQVVSCQINFELKRARLSYTPIIQEGTWIE